MKPKLTLRDLFWPRKGMRLNPLMASLWLILFATFGVAAKLAGPDSLAWGAAIAASITAWGAMLIVAFRMGR